jgi:hypothetical protein
MSLSVAEVLNQCIRPEFKGTRDWVGLGDLLNLLLLESQAEPGQRHPNRTERGGGAEGRAEQEPWAYLAGGPVGPWPTQNFWNFFCYPSPHSAAPWKSPIGLFGSVLPVPPCPDSRDHGAMDIDSPRRRRIHEGE